MTLFFKLGNSTVCLVMKPIFASINCIITQTKFNLVDQSLKFWNTFFDVVLDWAPTLKQIYAQDKDTIFVA